MSIQNITATIKADAIDVDYIVAVLSKHEAGIKPDTASDRHDLIRTRRLINELRGNVRYASEDA